MGSVLHTLFVVLANVIGWGLLVAGIAGFLFVCYRLVVHPGRNGRLPWL